MVRSTALKLWRAAYSLIEIMLVVASLSVVVGGGIYAIGKARQSSAETKLKQDVQRLNHAISVYMTNGGKIPDATNAQDVLRAMRRVAAKSRDAQGNEKKLQETAGLMGQMIDPRLAIRWQSDAEAAEGNLRAYWNDTDKRFYVINTGAAAGIREFYLGDMPEPEALITDANGKVINPNEDDRGSTQKLNTEAGWIWAAEAQAANDAPAPRGTGTGTGGSGTTTGGSDKDPVQLLAPQFDRAGGEYQLGQFPLSITISDPNPAGRADLMVMHSEEGSWQKYLGPVSVEPGQSLMARAAALDLDNFYDSPDTAIQTYTAVQVKPELAVNFSSNAYDYRELGGAIVGGNTTPRAAPGTVTLVNPADVPAGRMTSDNFRVFWTLDGSDPLDASNTTRIAGPAFSGTFPLHEIPLSVDQFVAAGLQVKVAAQAIDTAAFANSDVTTITLGVNRLPLPGCSISYGAGTVALNPSSAGGDLPENARMFYSTTGEDPGDNGNGGPASGGALLYGGAFPSPAGMAQIIARTTAPSGKEFWFATSGPTYAGVGDPPAGTFYATNNTSRNLYQFDPVTGSNIIRSSETLFTPSAVAYIPQTNRVYYTEAGGTRLASYEPATNLHSAAGTLNAAGSMYVPAAAPVNLVAFNSNLYYVAEGSDDLIRVELKPDGTVRQQFKYADITGDATAFTGIGDTAVDASGMLCISASNAWAAFSLVDLTTWSVPVNSPAQIWAGLAFGSSGNLYGIKSTDSGVVIPVNKTDGNPLAGQMALSPARTFDDCGGPLNDVAQNIAVTHYAISGGQPVIYRLNLDTGRQYPLFAGLPAGATSISHDAAGGRLYVVVAESGDHRLYRYELSGGTVTPLGSLTNTAQVQASAWFEGAFYYIPSGTDDLMKVVPGASNFTSHAKVADLNGGNSLGTVDGLSVGPSGLLHIAASDTMLFGRYDITNAGGLEVLRSGAGTGYAALTFSQAGTMHGVLASEAQKIQTVDEGTGVASFKVNTIPGENISDITGVFSNGAAPVADNYFAVDGNTKHIFRFETATGRNAILTSGAPWPLGALAYDSESSRLYYVRAGGFELGRYDIGSNTHTLLTALNAAGLSYTPAAAPANLTWFNGSLYYISPGTDDLVRVDLTPSGTTGEQWKEADLNANASIGDAGDLAVDSNGLLYISTTSQFARFDLKTLSGFTTLATDPAGALQSLYVVGGNSFFGTLTSAPRELRAVSTANGSAGATVATSPPRVIADAASAQPRVNVTPAAGFNYATVSGVSALYRINLSTGALQPVTASCPVAPEAVAWDAAENRVYYTEAGATAGNPNRIFRFDPTTQQHSLVTDLSTASGYAISTTPKNLLRLFGDLYTIQGDDDFVRISVSGSGTTLTKMADLSGNTANFGTVGAVTLKADGTMLFASETTSLLASASIYAPRAYTVISTTAVRNTSLAFSGTTLRGTHASTPSVLETVNQLTGARSSATPVTPSRSILDIAGALALNSYLPDCYAVGGGNRTIWKVNPWSGANRAITTNAPFDISSLARSSTRNKLYYLENAATNWRLGSYDVATDTHSILATLGSGSWENIPAARPENLFNWDGNLFFIAPNSDDLYQITLNTAGTAVTSMAIVDDLSYYFAPNTFVNTGDAAVGYDGIANFSGGAGWNGYFNMFSHKGLVTFPPQTQNWAGMMILGGTMFASKPDEAGRIYQVQRGVGTPSSPVDTFPQITISDLAAEDFARPASLANSLWVISENTGHLGEFLNWNQINVVSRDWGELKYYSGGAATSFTGGSRVESLAVDDSGKAYFVRNVPTVVDGVTYRKALFMVDTAALTWGSTPTPPVATFVGDLTQALSAMGAVSTTAEQDDITGLAVGYDWKLHALYNRGGSSTGDYLLRINSLAVDSANSLVNVSVTGLLTGSGETVTNGQDLVFAASSLQTLYVTDAADDEVYQVNYKTGAITGVFSTDSASFEALASFNVSGEVLGVNSDTGSPANEVMTVVNGGSNDTSRFNAAAVSGGTLTDIEGSAFPVGPLSLGNSVLPPVFAVDRSTKIYRIDPANGITWATSTTMIETADALFNADAIAYDAASGLVFYSENSDTTIRLAKYDPATRVHTLIGDLKSTGAYRPSTHPQHLIHWQGALYYVNNGTSDVVKVQLDAAAAAITAQSLYVTMSGGAAWTVTAAAMDNTGLLWFQEGSNLRSYNLRTRSTLSTALATGGVRHSMTQVVSTGAFYATPAGQPGSIASLNLGTGSTGAGLETSPAVSLYDVAGGTSAPAAPAVSTTFYAVNSSEPTIYMFDPATGENTGRYTDPYFTGIAAVATSADGNLVYYVEEGTPYRLAVYRVSDGMRTQIAPLQTSGAETAWAQPKAMVWYNGSLYYTLENEALLRKIELSADGITPINQFNAGTLIGPSESGGVIGAVGDMAVDSQGWLYVSAASRILKYHLPSNSGLTTISNAPAAFYTSLFIGANGTDLYGVSQAEPGKVQQIDRTTGAGTLVATLSPARTVVDTASPNVVVPYQQAAQRYFITGACNTIHRIDLETGADYVVSFNVWDQATAWQPSAIAHDFVRNQLYLIGYTGGSDTAWVSLNLGAYNLTTGAFTDLGSIVAAPLAYKPVKAPLAMVYANDRLYYVNRDTDDLVEITLNAGRTAIASQAKIADIRSNNSLGDLDALTLGPDGRLYMSRSDAHLLASIDFRTKSGFVAHRSSAEADHYGLTFSDSGVLHVIESNQATKLQTLSSPGASPVFKVNNRTGAGMWDITGLNSDSLPALSDAVWAVAKNTAGTGHELVKFSNYATSPAITSYGNLSYLSSGSPVVFPVSAPVHALAVTAGGVGYFVASGDLVIDGSTYRRPLFSINVATLAAGGPAQATLIGDLEPRLRALLGASGYLGTSQPVTGLAIHPSTGVLYALVQAGDVGVTDKLVRINDPTVSAGNVMDVSLVGTLTGSTVSVNLGLDLAFTPSGQLYVTDANTGKLLLVDTADASVDAVHGAEWPAGSTYAGLAINPANSDIIASDTSSDAVRRAVAGDGNDVTMFSYASLFSRTDVQAMSFASYAVSWNPSPPLPPYFAVNRSASIYRVNPLTGATAVETSSALFNADAVAYDGTGGTVYYLENSDTTIRLAKYAAGTHTLIGDLKTAGTAVPATHPQHLIHYGDSLYYVNNGSSDIIRVRLDPTASSIVSQTKLVTMSTGANWTVKAAALDNSGLLWFQEGTTVRRYDLRNRSGLTTVGTSVPAREALLFTRDTALGYGAATASMASISPFNDTNGTAGTAVATVPSISLYDISGGHSAPAASFVDTNYYATDGTSAIYMVDPATGQRALLTNSTIVGAIGGLAADPTGQKIAYFGEAPYYTLCYYDRTTGTHTAYYTLGSINDNFGFGPDMFSMTWFNNRLWVVPNTYDRLVMCEFLPTGAMNILYFDNMSGGTYDLGTVGDVTVDNTGTMYISGSNGFARYNLTSLSGWTVLNSAPAWKWTGLMTGADGTTLYGVRDTEPGKLYLVDKATGNGSAAVNFTPASSMTDLAAPQQSVAGNPIGKRMVIVDACYTIEILDMEYGSFSTMTNTQTHQPTGIAHDHAGHRVYTIGYEPSSSAPYFWDLTLEMYDLVTGINVRVGSLITDAPGYPATMPVGPCFFAGGKIYYIHPYTDDLVELSVNSSGTAITGAAKVADITGNAASLGKVDGLALQPDGTLYIGRSDADYLATWNFKQRSGLTVLKSSPAAKYTALGLHNGILHGFTPDAVRDMKTIAPPAWNATFKVSTWGDIQDIAGLDTDDVTFQSSPLYAIAKNTAQTGYQWVRFNNYDTAGRTVTNFGDLHYLSSGSPVKFAHPGPELHALAVESNGTAWFVASGDLTVNGTTVRRGLFTLNAATQTEGTPVTATLVGDLEPRLRALTGASGFLGTQWVTGLAIQPGTGALYGLMLEGDSNTPDRVFHINDATASSGNLNDLRLIGTLTGAAGSVTHAKDLAFAPDGALYVSDYATGSVFRVDPSDASVDAVYSSGASEGQYVALAVDPQNSAMAGSVFGSTSLKAVVAGAINDTALFNYGTAFSLNEIRAMNFATIPVTWTPTPPTRYFAVTGSGTSIYGLTIPGGVTSVVTSTCLFTPATVAHDPDTGFLFYTENVALGFRLARFNPADNTHTLIGSIDTAAPSYDPSSAPANLEFYGGSLYYIHSLTDDLVRIDLNPAATSVTASFKVADITSGSSVFATVHDLAVDRDGILHFTSLLGLHTYDLVRLTGHSLKGGLTLRGVVFADDGVTLYGAATTAATHLYRVDRSNGGTTDVATYAPAISPVDFAGYPPASSAAVAGSHYAVNGSKTLYKVDAATGAVQAVNAAAPFNMGSVSYDTAGGMIYYTESGAASWKLGSYNLASGVHTDLGRGAESGGWAVASGSEPGNLFVFNGAPHYVKPGTDDVIRIELNAARTGIQYYTKHSDLFANTASFTSIGDVTEVNEAGKIFFTGLRNDGAKVIAEYTMTTAGGYAALWPTTRTWNALLRASSDTLYGVPSDAATSLFTGPGLTTAGAAVSGGLQFSDFASVSSGAVDPAAYYFTAASSPAIWTMAANASGKLSGGARLVTATAPFNVAGIAVDPATRMIYYTENAGAAFRLGRYSVDSGVHTVLGNMMSGWTYNATTGSSHLVFFAGDLYYVQSGTDDLIRIDLNNGTVALQEKVADLTSNAVNFGTIRSAARDANGYMAITYSNAPYFSRFNLRRRNGIEHASTNTLQLSAITGGLGGYAADPAQPTYVTQYGVSTTDNIARVLLPGADSGVTYPVQTNPVLTIEEFSSSAGSADEQVETQRYYATDGTPMIWRVDPQTGVNSPLPYNSDQMGMKPCAIAYDSQKDEIYVGQMPGEGFRLAMFRASADQYAGNWSLQAADMAYIPASMPRSMVWYNGALWYITPGTDDLVRLEVRAGQSAPVSQARIADLTGNASALQVRAMSLRDDGMLFISADTSFYSYNMRTQGPLTLLNSSAPAYETLLHTGLTTLFGTRTAAATVIDSVNQSTGGATAGVVTAPVKQFLEMTGPNTAAGPSSYDYFASARTTTLYRVDPAALTTGSTTAAPMTALSPVASFAADSIAYDATRRVIYYLENTDTSTRLGRYVLGTTNSTSSIRAIMDQTASATMLNIGVRPYNLTYYDGSLYFIRRETGTTAALLANKDDLIRITLSADGASVVSMLKVADVSSTLNVSGLDVNSATVDDTGTMWFSWGTAAAAKLSKFSLRTLSGYGLVNNALSQRNSLAWIAPAGSLFGGGYNTTAGTTFHRTFYPISSAGVLGTPGRTGSIAVTVHDMASGNFAPAPPSSTLAPAYIAGEFHQTSTGNYRGIAKLKPDGTLDTSFSPGGVNAGAKVRGLERTSDGKVLIGGDFTTVNGTARAALARLNGDGTLDSTFAPTITLDQAYTLDWGTVSIAESGALTGTDTNASAGSGSAGFGLATAGGFSGFGEQSLNNVNGSGVNVKLRYSQNMSPGGPRLYGPGGPLASSLLAGPNPDARVTGPYGLVFTGDQSGTITPATLGLDFSEPVLIDSVILGGVSTVNGKPEAGLVRAWSGAATGGSLVPASEFANLSSNSGPLYGSASDSVTTNAAGNAILSSPASGVYRVAGAGASEESRFGRARFGWNTSPVQSLAVSTFGQSRSYADTSALAAASASSSWVNVPWSTTETGAAIFSADVTMTSGLLQPGSWASTEAQDAGYVARFGNSTIIPYFYMGPASGTTMTLVYRFAAPVADFDLIVYDVDENDVVNLVAKDGAGAAITSFAGWHQISGDLTTATLPAATAPAWNAATGALTSAAAGLNQNRSYSVFRPAVPVTEIGITFTGGAASGKHVYTALHGAPSVNGTSQAVVAKPLGAAQDFSVFTSGNFSMSSGGGSISKGVATGGNAVYTGLSIGNDLTAAVDGTDQWIVNGSLTTDGNGALNRGNVVYGSSPNASLIYVNNGGTKRVGSSGIIASTWPTVLARSAEWAAMPTTSGASVNYAYNAGDGKTAITVDAANISGLVTVNMDASKFTSVSGMTIQNIGPSTVLVMNIPGATPPQLSGFGTTVTGTAANPMKQIVYHFPSATTASFNSIEVKGSVLAPAGTVYIGTGGGQFRGNVIAAAVDLRSVGTFGGSEFTGSYANPAAGGTTPVQMHLSKIVFRKQSTTPGKVWAIAAQADGKVVIGGEFNAVNGVARRNVARLNADGTLDTTFDPLYSGTGPDGAVWSLRTLPGGKVQVGGAFTTWHGSSAGAKLVTLNADGSRDTAFSSPLSVAATDTVRWLGDGGTGTWVGGKFSTPTNNVALLNTANGTAAGSFAVGTGANGTVHSGALINSAIVLAGEFTSINGTSRNYVAKVSNAGAVDSAFTSPAPNAAAEAAFSSGGSWLHLGGRFSTHGTGNTRQGVSAVDGSTGTTVTGAWGLSGMTVTNIANIK